MTPALLLFATLSGGDAEAYYYTFNVWPRDEFPVRWFKSDVIDDSIDEADQERILLQSFQNWLDEVPCAELTTDYQGENGFPSADQYGFNTNDGINMIVFEDPAEVLGGSTLGATSCDPTGGQAFIRAGERFTFTRDCDIVFNKTVDWVSTEDILAGECNGESSLEATATHEIGHMWGLAHSCDDPADDADLFKPEGVSCDDPDLANAVMFWSSGSCEVLNFTSDDIDGMNSLYGPYCTFEATTDASGGTGVEVCFEVDCNEEPTDFTWDFGDGQTDSSTLETCHTFDEKGQFSVTLETEGTNEACGDWDSTSRRRGYVTVCGEPAPAEGFKGLFTYDHYDGMTYQMINQTDTSVYGCVDQVVWQVKDGNNVVDEISAWSPKIDFSRYSDEEKEYTVVLNVGGPGGLTAGQITIVAENMTGDVGGCSVLAGTTLGGVGALVGLVAAARRRED